MLIAAAVILMAAMAVAVYAEENTAVPGWLAFLVALILGCALVVAVV